MAKTLEAILSAQETVTNALEEIQGELEQTAAEAGVTAAAFATLSSATADLDRELADVDGDNTLNDVAESVDDTSDSMSSVNRTLDEFGDKSKEVRNATDEVSDSVQDADNAFRNFDRSLGNVANIGDDLKRRMRGLSEFPDLEEKIGIGSKTATNLKRATDQFDELNDKLSKAGVNARALDSATEDLRDAQTTLGVVTQDTKDELDQEAEELFRAAQQGTDLAETKDIVRDANSQLAQSAGFTQEKLEEEAREMMETKLQAHGLAESKEEAAEAARELYGAASAAGDGVDKEGQSMREAAFAADGLEDMKDAVTGANRNLAAAAGGAAELVSEESDELLRVMATSDSTADALAHLARGEDELSRAAQLAQGRLDDLSDEEKQNVITALLAAGATDELSDEFDELALSASVAGSRVESAGDELGEFGADSLAASLNVGPFNFALRRMGTQVPQLITLFGGLAGAIGGVATAATAATAAFGGIFAAGAFMMAENIKRTNSEVEETSEAMEKLMQQWREMLAQAAEPLFNQQSVDMFQRAMEGVAIAVNITAQSIAEIQDELSGFQSNIGDIFFSNFDETAKEIQRTVIDFLPWLERFTEWFMVHLPNALEFFRKQGLRIMPVIAEFEDSLSEALKAFAEFGVTFLKGILPALGSFLKVLTDIIDVFNSLPDGILSTAIELAALIFLIKSAIEFGEELAEKGQDIISWATNMAEDMRILTDETDEAANAFEDLSARLDEFNDARAGRGAEGNEDTGVAGTLADAGLFGLGVANTVSGGAITGSITGKIASSLGSISSLRGALSALTGAIRIAVGAVGSFTGVLLVVTALLWVFWDAISTGIDRFSEMLNLGQGFKDAMGGLEVILGGVMSVLTGVWEAFAAVGQTIVNIVSIGIVGFFEVLAAVLDLLLNDIGPVNEMVFMMGQLFSFAAEKSGELMENVRGIGEGIDRWLANTATGLENFINNNFISTINRMIAAYNRLLKVPGFKMAVSRTFGVNRADIDRIEPLEDVDFASRDFEIGGRGASSSMRERREETNIYGDYKPENHNYDMSNSEYNMRPEEKARIKGLINEAIREAGQQRRIQDGGI